MSENMIQFMLDTGQAPFRMDVEELPQTRNILLVFLIGLFAAACNDVEAQEPDFDAHCDKIEDSLAWLVCTAEAELTATAEARPPVPIPTGVKASTGLYPPHILLEWDDPPDTAQRILVEVGYPPNPGHPLEGGEKGFFNHYRNPEDNAFSGRGRSALVVKPSEFSYVRPCDVSDSHIRITNRCFGSSTFNKFALKAGRIYGVRVTFAINDRGREHSEVIWVRIPLDAPTPTPWPTATWTPLPYWANTPGFWSPTPTPVPPGWDTPTPEPTPYYGTVIPTLTPAPWQFTHWTPTPTRTPYPTVTPRPTMTPYPTAVLNRDRETLERQVADLQAQVDLLERKLAALERYLGVTWGE